MSFEDLGYRLDCWLNRIKRRLFWWRYKSAPLPPGPLSPIIAATLQAHSAELARNISSNNPFLQSLKDNAEKRGGNNEPE